MTKKYKEDFDDNENESFFESTNEFKDNNNLFDKHEFEDEDDSDELSEISEDLDDDDDDFYKKTIIEDSEDTEDTDTFAEEKQKKRRGNLKPKLIGKHSLSYDTIFKGKQNVSLDDNEYNSEHIIKNAGGSLDINDNDINSEESRNSIDEYRNIRLKHDVNGLLKTNTDINFTANRRKPAKTDFNAYYAMLLKELIICGYSRTEIFVELSGYFSDNIWNMFQLLDKQYSNIVIKELKEKYGLSDMNKIDFLA